MVDEAYTPASRNSAAIEKILDFQDPTAGLAVYALVAFYEEIHAPARHVKIVWALDLPPGVVGQALDVLIAADLIREEDGDFFLAA